MNQYVIRPFTSDGKRILPNDIYVNAFNPAVAKEKAEAIYPGCFEYRIIHVGIMPIEDEEAFPDDLPF